MLLRGGEEDQRFRSVWAGAKERGWGGGTGVIPTIRFSRYVHCFNDQRVFLERTGVPQDGRGGGEGACDRP